MLLIWPTCNFLSNNGSSAKCNWQYTGVRTRAYIRSRHRDRNGLEVLDNILTISLDIGTNHVFKMSEELRLFR